MKILIIARDFKPNLGGIAEYASQFAHCLSEAGDEVTVFCPGFVGHDRVENSLQIYNGALLRVKSRLGKYLIKLLNKPYCTFKLRRILRRNRIELIIISSDYRGASYLRGLEVPYIIVFHGGDIGVIEKQWWPRCALRYRKMLKSVSRASGILCNSNYTKELLLGQIEGKVEVPEIVVSGCGVREPPEINFTGSAQAKKEWQLEGKKVLLTVGRLVERKGFDSVLHVMAELKNSYDDLFYIIAGNGPDRDRLENLAIGLGITDRVRFVGGVSDAQVHSLYQACDIFVMPNRSGRDGDIEGFGIVYLEANLYGVPVIGGNSGGVPDAVSHGVSGFLVDPYDCDELRVTIERLLGNAALRNKMGRAGYKRVIEQFTWPTIVCKLRPFLQRCASEKRCFLRENGRQ